MGTYCTLFTGPALTVAPPPIGRRFGPFLKPSAGRCGPLEVVADCNALIDCFDRGRVHCCDRSRRAADLRRLLWARIDERGGAGGLSLRCVRAHIRSGQGGDALVEPDRVINAHADRLAGLGSAAAEALSPCGVAAVAYRRQKAFYRCVARLAGNWPVDVHKERDYAPVLRQAKKGPCWTPNARMNRGSLPIAEPRVHVAV